MGVRSKRGHMDKVLRTLVAILALFKKLLAYLYVFLS
jgi:hypothetical protein